MSQDLAVSMEELERESAELLPSRETLYCHKYGSYSSSYSYSYSFTEVTQQIGLVNLSNVSFTIF
jgi:hypothetical protein